MDSKKLLSWYRANKRDLPWRRDTDAYRVLVSEFMLQQTQVATVLPYYERFIAAFPTAEALTGANEQEVLALWQGLGYYRRARSLQEAARHLSKSVPKSYAEWLKLPGVGDYTAAALASIVNKQAVACVDGNVRRVMARQHGLQSTGSHLHKASTAHAQEGMGKHRPGDYNQALMEMGATICTPRIPLCSKCPIASSCVALYCGQVDELPLRTPRKESVALIHVCVVPRWRGKVGVREITDGWWRGLYEFPRVEAADVAAGLRLLDVVRCEELCVVRHTVTHHRINLHAFTSATHMPGLTWLTPSQLKALPMPSPQRRIARMLCKEAAA